MKQFCQALSSLAKATQEVKKNSASGPRRWYGTPLPTNQLLLVSFPPCQKKSFKFVDTCFCFIMLLTDRQTHQHRWSHNFHCNFQAQFVIIAYIRGLKVLVPQTRFWIFLIISTFDPNAAHDLRKLRCNVSETHLCLYLSQCIFFSNRRTIGNPPSGNLAQPHIQQHFLDVHEERFARYWWEFLRSHSNKAVLHVPCWPNRVSWRSSGQSPGRKTGMCAPYLSGRFHVGTTNWVLLQCWWQNPFLWPPRTLHP